MCGWDSEDDVEGDGSVPWEDVRPRNGELEKFVNNG